MLACFLQHIPRGCDGCVWGVARWAPCRWPGQACLAGHILTLPEAPAPCHPRPPPHCSASAAGGHRGRPHAPLLLPAPRRRLLWGLRCASRRYLAQGRSNLGPGGGAGYNQSAWRLHTTAAAPHPTPPHPTQRLKANAYSHTPLHPTLQRRWWRRRWGWRATRSCTWETTSVSVFIDVFLSYFSSVSCCGEPGQETAALMGLRAGSRVCPPLSFAPAPSPDTGRLSPRSLRHRR